MRIMHVITRGDEFGGAQTHVRDLAVRQRRDGHDVTVVTGAFGALTDVLEADGVATVFAPGLLRAIHPVHDVRAVASLRGIIRDRRPHLVSTHSSKAGIVGRAAAKLVGTPCLYTVHGWAFNDRTPQPARAVYRGVEWATGLLSARIICVSDFDRGLGERGGIPARKLTTVHNGLPDVAPGLVARHDRGSELRLICVARFAEPKDFPTLIAAMQGLDRVHLDLAGDGPLLGQMQALAAELGVADRVHFLGRRADVPELLAKADGFVLSSHSEGFPISTLEAMRAGLPVIVSNVGGAPEAVIEGRTGFVVPRADPAAMRARIAELVASGERRRTMGAAGRARFLEEFSFERMHQKTMAIYEELAQTLAPSPSPNAGREGSTAPVPAHGGAPQVAPTPAHGEGSHSSPAPAHGGGLGRGNWP